MMQLNREYVMLAFMEAAQRYYRDTQGGWCRIIICWRIVAVDVPLKNNIWMRDDKITKKYDCDENERLKIFL